MTQSGSKSSILLFNCTGTQSDPEAFEEHGLSILEVDSELAAWRVLSQKNLDAVLVLVRDAGEDELSLLHKSRNSETLCHLPYFAISANLALLHPDFELHCDDLFDHCFSKGKECFGDIGKTIQRRIALARCRREALSAQLQRQLKRTITTLSHEFRTPLVSILTGAEILKDTLKEDERDSVVELVASVHRGGKRLESLVNDFILLQKNILGKPATYTETAPHRTPLFPIVSEAVQHFVDYLDSEISALPEIRLIHEISDSNSAGLVEVFDEQITDVLKRLLANAYTFGGNAGPIEVRVSYKEREAQVSIRDHGPGFESDKELQEIFDPFRQFHREKREQQGCGLGLTISQLLASLNGVRLSMTRPEEGSGAVANLWFELIEEKSAERECGARI